MDKEADLFDAARFGADVEEQVKKVGGYRNAAQLSGVHFTTLAHIAKGRAPSVEHFFRLKRWMTGKVPRQ